MTTTLRLRTALCLLMPLLASMASTAKAQVFDEKFEHWPVNLKINGVIIAGGGMDDGSLMANVLFRYRRAPTVLIHDESITDSFLQEIRTTFEPPLAKSDPRDSKRKDESNDAGREADSNGSAKPDSTLLPPLEVLEEAPKSPLVVLEAAADLGSQIRDATADCEVMVLLLGKPMTEQQRASMAAARSTLQSHIDNGKVLICDGAATDVLSTIQITNDSGHPTLCEANDIVPDSIIHTQYTHKDRPRLLSALASHPRLVGIGIERNTAIVLSGRKLQAIGAGSATFCLAANERQPIRVQTIESNPGRRSPEDWLVDLTEWRRDAIDRQLAPFPPAEPPTPHVENGTLIIVGGGGMPKGLMERMVEMAGGKDEARMVYVPCAEADRISPKQGTVEMWKKMGVKHATFIHTKDRNRANSDEEFYAPLKDATGVWFGGGRQWNFADSYYGTKTHELMKEVLKRGGVIGGSSAGASIQARYLARATPIGNFRIMAPGYERGGLGFIGGVAIDQHFSQRGRQKDMTQLVNRYPQMLGIGLDEATAIIVKKSTAEVVGKGRAHFYDRNLPVYPDQPDFVALPEGSVYDLATRETVKDTTPPQP